MLRTRLAAWAMEKVNENGGPSAKGLQPNVATEIPEANGCAAAIFSQAATIPPAAYRQNGPGCRRVIV